MVPGGRLSLLFDKYPNLGIKEARKSAKTDRISLTGRSQYVEWKKGKAYPLNGVRLTTANSNHF